MLYKFQATLAEILELDDPLSVSELESAEWLALVQKAINVTADDFTDAVVKNFIDNYFIPTFYHMWIVEWNIEDEEDFDMYMWKMSMKFNKTKAYYKGLITDINAVKALLSSNKYGAYVSSVNKTEQTSEGDVLNKRNDTPLAATNADLATDTYLSGSDRQESSSSLSTSSTGSTTDASKLFLALDKIPGVRDYYNEWLAEFETIFSPADDYDDPDDYDDL